ncbi:hypothetical protein BN1221_02620 [Brenneria goodwinii]|uniref:Uncharacterized protein n=1 Tax=Brenneria goodwinii TaxID=1109412 RepID=A0A0G4JW75_9GAMM|nr:hypothetical protein BN1221_02620 [Brenneria goodwinii]
MRLALTGQRKRCAKTLPAFLSDAALAFAASVRLTRRSCSPQHNFLRPEGQNGEIFWFYYRGY